ncbi:Tetraacyldisaccharide 4'-kinase (Lipid A 4'-kinase) [Bradyrhizobium sp. ORS 278]|uniref:Tetraacyldisaccharide 4'-kinase n=1 Tax=Bradyrhizobium sp. (strain ORS 278) TaxID=114615 RepID=LPXK_BRASO|nr:tetraacyldisaccharide 4'-kinase [Bradyrhizobium sp. ORS 278]A4Z0S1.1 RecName: Full=Tetraacyldisaccharide 4'-kinase; AltName: Full=Lipid A 4'-kinase [Bradyrhizobium sp. ORS 278]CAL79747.1 Tetraacyldisaccharide 4'-kinase (Lipid A 4'-kinase) [Bradyrhizobium sp. ORS 278]
MREPAFWHRPPSWQSHLLSPLSMLYGAVAARRMAQPGIKAGVPVICVGNYHVGGAGKTPTVLALTALLRGQGEQPVVLSRGYGGRLPGPVLVDPAAHGAADVGDEPLMMAAHVPVVVSRARADGVGLAKAHRASVILMDDGFQNPSITKDLALIVVDGGRGLGNARVFPAGPLRTPLPPQLARTDALMIIGRGEAGEAVASRVAAAGKPVFRAQLQPDAGVVASLAGRPLLAFAGIGDPQRFFRSLRASGLEIRAERPFPDHHPFTDGDIKALVDQATREQLALVTTEKDLVRLRGRGWDHPELAPMAFPVTLQFDDETAVRSLVARRLSAARAS